MNEDLKGDLKEKKNKKTFSYLSRLATILVVVFFGLLAVNQALEFRYKSVFLAQPCDLCKKYNENQSGCIDDCFKFELHLFPTNTGGLIDAFGNCYDLRGMRIDCEPGVQKIKEEIDYKKIFNQT